MPRKRTGHVTRKGDRYLAYIGREYLGTRDSEDAAKGLIAAALQLDKQRDDSSFAARGEAYMREQERLFRERRGSLRGFNKEWSLWNAHIRGSSIYMMPIAKIRRQHVQAMLDAVCKKQRVQIKPQAGGGLAKVATGKRVGERTVYKVRSRLSAFFDTCGELESNPASRCAINAAKTVKRRKDGDRKPHLHDDEIFRLFDLLEMTDEHRAFYALGIYAGLRVNELCGLRWENFQRLDGEQPEVWIRYSYNEHTKTEGSQREIPLLPQAVKEIRAYRASLPSVPIGGVVFPGDDGKVRAPGYTARWYDKPYTNEAGKTVVRIGYRTLAQIRDHIELKHVRHSCATHLLAGTWTNGHEWPIEKVSEMLGHEDIATTIKHYASRQVSRLHAEVAKGLPAKRGEVKPLKPRTKT
jgi:integrase